MSDTEEIMGDALPALPPKVVQDHPLDVWECLELVREEDHTTSDRILKLRAMYVENPEEAERQANELLARLWSAL